MSDRPLKAPSTGLGDTVAYVIAITSLGLVVPTPNCNCTKRKEWLNKLVPYEQPKPGPQDRGAQ